MSRKRATLNNRYRHRAIAKGELRSNKRRKSIRNSNEFLPLLRLSRENFRQRVNQGTLIEKVTKGRRVLVGNVKKFLGGYDRDGSFLSSSGVSINFNFTMGTTMRLLITINRPRGVIWFLLTKNSTAKVFTLGRVNRNRKRVSNLLLRRLTITSGISNNAKIRVTSRVRIRNSNNISLSSILTARLPTARITSGNRKTIRINRPRRIVRNRTLTNNSIISRRTVASDISFRAFTSFGDLEVETVQVCLPLDAYLG